MPEPTTTSIATLATAGATVPPLVAFGVSIGLRSDVLVAGFLGSLVAIALLNAVPSTGDTWRALIRDSLRRVSVAFASAVTAGYITPLALLMVAVPEALLLSMAFFVGVFAQRWLLSLARRYLGHDAAPAGGAKEG